MKVLFLEVYFKFISFIILRRKYLLFKSRWNPLREILAHTLFSNKIFFYIGNNIIFNYAGNKFKQNITFKKVVYIWIIVYEYIYNINLLIKF